MNYLKSLPGRIDQVSLEAALAERQKLWSLGRGEVFKGLLNSLPQIKSQLSFKDGVVKIGERSEVTNEQFALIEHVAQELRSWKKGPYQLFGLDIDSEWKAEIKWERMKPLLPALKDKNVLDIGCNNGYYMFRMLEEGARFVLGLDPIPQVNAQFQLMKHFLEMPQLQNELWGVEHLPYFRDTFDVIFYMGVLYHHKNPIEHLYQIRDALRPGGEVVIETIGISGESEVALTPRGNYQNMPNVWFVPTLNCLMNWLEKSKFVDIKIISRHWNETEEQRPTFWSPKDTYRSSISPDNPYLTVEGYPIPQRFCVKAKRKG
ncbi:MAG: tRNA 5-methoxyuridine(34)/uridine 5-oxyacetic acid(34) synthase CmoB [Bacteriovoracaceae bacterium]|nr:tRNA 5-methoxyuridine(34)/uridine 5-oxyacetic acid(34) synthase CmoB [Bacteriovoracaceae bacterium]